MTQPLVAPILTVINSSKYKYLPPEITGIILKFLYSNDYYLEHCIKKFTYTHPHPITYIRDTNILIEKCYMCNSPVAWCIIFLDFIKYGGKYHIKKNVQKILYKIQNYYFDEWICMCVGCDKKIYNY